MLRMFAWLLQSGTELTDKFQDIKIKRNQNSELSYAIQWTVTGTGGLYTEEGIISCHIKTCSVMVDQWSM